MNTFMHYEMVIYEIKHNIIEFLFCPMNFLLILLEVQMSYRYLNLKLDTAIFIRHLFILSLFIVFLTGIWKSHT